METLLHCKVKLVTITADADGQRIDNFLLRELKGVPRSHIYRILRKGEVRINKKRAKAMQKLSLGDEVRIPPVKVAAESESPRLDSRWRLMLESAVVLEDDDLIVFNKPSGVAVHGGSGIEFGLIEAVREFRPDLEFVELVHRIDRDTSGLVLLAKSRPSLLALHELLQNGGIDKRYLAMVAGEWHGGRKQIKHKLIRDTGDRREKVRVDERGKEAESIFIPQQCFEDRTLLEVQILTGRMHQIRTQLAHMGFPIIGDDRYGDFALNKHFKKSVGIKRLFLHAYKISFRLPTSGKHYNIKIPLADDLVQAL